MARDERAVIHKIPPMSAAREVSVIVTLPALRPAIDVDETPTVGRKAATAPTLEEAPLLRKAYDAPTLAEAPAPEPPTETRSYAQWDAVAPSSPLVDYVSRESDPGATPLDPCLAVLTTPADEGAEVGLSLELANRPVASSPGSDPLPPPPAQMCGGDVSIRTIAAATPEAENPGLDLTTIGLSLVSVLLLAGLVWRRRRERGAPQPGAAGVLGGVEAQGVNGAPAPDASILSKVAVLMRGKRQEEPPPETINLARITRSVRASGSAAAVLAESVFETFDDAIDAPTMRLGDDAATAAEAPARPAESSRRADADAGMETEDLDLVEPGDAVAASAAINAARTRLEGQR